MIGVELDDARALAIGVDDQGEVRARAQVDAAGDLGAAAAKAVAEVQHAMPGAVSGLIGVAATSPESPDVASVASQLALKFGGSAATQGAVGRGRPPPRRKRGLAPHAA